MQLGAKLRAQEGIAEASCIMATPANLEQLRGRRSRDRRGGRALGPAGRRARRARRLRRSHRRGRSDAAVVRHRRAMAMPRRSGCRSPASRSASTRADDADLALISVPGDYAAAEALKALAQGLNVMLFSDNVAVADELAIKTYAREHGSPRHGAGLRHGDRQRHSARLRQCRAARRHRLVAASGTGSAGGDVPDPPCGRRRLAGARHRRARSQGGDRRHHDAAGARRARCRSRHARHRADLQAAGAGDRTQDPRCGRLGGQAGGRAFSRRHARRRARRAARRRGIAAARGRRGGRPRQREGARPNPPARRRRRNSRRSTMLAKRMAPSQCAVRGLFTGGTFCYEAQLAFRARSSPAARMRRPTASSRSTARWRGTSSSTWATTTTRAAGRIR